MRTVPSQSVSCAAMSAMLAPPNTAAMDERGTDIRPHRSKHLCEELAQPFDVVITMCDNAAENCPEFLGPANVFIGALLTLRLFKAVNRLGLFAKYAMLSRSGFEKG